MPNSVAQEKTIYLLDGHSYIYRAFHAIKHLSNSKGFPTNAVFGFTKMVLKLIHEKKPKYFVVALDAKGPTFRHELYPEYKGTRPPMPEDLILQLPHIKSVIQGLNIKTIEIQGYEADDVIGTLARMGEEKDYQVVMVTGDKDFRQLISPHISMWDTMKDRLTDYDAFVSDYGLEPKQIIDLMGLSGDNSDNIPGVPGVGEKTALKLIKEYGTFDNVFQNIDKVKGKKLKENLGNSYDMALLSKKLVTIDCHVPFKESIEDLIVGEPDSDRLAEIFLEMEFKGLWDQFSTRSKEEGKVEKEGKKYHLCLSKEDVLTLMGKIKNSGFVSFDTETTSRNPLKAELVGISFSMKEKEAYYLPLGHLYLGAPEQLSPSQALEIISPILEDESILKIGQNIKYDAMVLKQYGVELKGIHFDTMIASYIIDPGLRQHNLDHLAQKYLNHKMISFHEVVGKGKSAVNFSEVDIERAMEYSCEDADITLRIKAILEHQVKNDKNQTLFQDLEMKLLPVLMSMELTGIRIDGEFLRNMSKDFTLQINEVQKKIYEEASMEFNVNSPKQMGFVLFEKLNLPVQKKTAKTKNYSTNVDVLKKLAQLDYKIAELILRFRTLSKLKSTYLDALVKLINPSTGRIHTSYNQTVAATGRLSSSNPNLQNIPIRTEEGRAIRKGFIPDEGYLFMAADYSQVELRLFAHYSGDVAFIDAFKNEEDIHSRTASEIFELPLDEVTQEMRRIAKAINFGIIYGMGSRKLADSMNIEGKTAKKYIESYYERYKGVARFKKEIIETVKKNGYVTTLLNRRRYLPEIESENNRVRAEAERMAVNTPIQGSAADLIKKAMINIHQRLKNEKLGAKMLLQVHDELVFEVPENEVEEMKVIIKEEMEGVYPLTVPLKVDIGIGKNWDEAH